MLAKVKSANNTTQKENIYFNRCLKHFQNSCLAFGLVITAALTFEYVARLQRTFANYELVSYGMYAFFGLDLLYGIA